MTTELNKLFEALSGVVSEQRALQAYALDFTTAAGNDDFPTMMRAFHAALRLYNVNLREYDDVPGMDEIIRDINRLMEKVDRMKVEQRVRSKHRRR